VREIKSINQYNGYQQIKSLIAVDRQHRPGHAPGFGGIT
jgi:hypothetical protein